MEILFKNIFFFLDYFVIGFIGLSLLFISEYVRKTWKELYLTISTNEKVFDTSMSVIVFALFSFTIGVVVDSLGYSSLSILHHWIIADVIQDICGDLGLGQDIDALKNFYLQSFWQETSPTYMNALDRTVKAIRIVRGLGMMLLVVAIIFLIIRIKVGEKRALPMCLVAMFMSVLMLWPYWKFENRYHRHVWVLQADLSMLEEGKPGCKPLHPYRYKDPTSARQGEPN